MGHISTVMFLLLFSKMTNLVLKNNLTDSSMDRDNFHDNALNWRQNDFIQMFFFSEPLSDHAQNFFSLNNGIQFFKKPTEVTNYLTFTFTEVMHERTVNLKLY